MAHARSLALSLVLAAAVAGTAHAAPSDRGEPLTEDEVVALALKRGPLAETIEGSIAAEDGRALVANPYPLPQVSYLREQTFGPAGTGEDYLSIAQTIRLGHRPRARAAAREGRIAAAKQRGEATRVEVAAEARERFYAVLFREQRVAAMQSWIERIDEMLAIVARREARGDAAVYDRRRLERERAVAMARLEAELAALERTRARLGALLGGSHHGLQVTGALLPDDPPDALEALRARASRRPDLRALDLHAGAAGHELSALSRAWLPDLRLEAGWKGVGFVGQSRSDGFLASALLSFQPRRYVIGSRRAAEGEARAARGRRALLASELDGDIAGARAEALRLREGAIAFREQAVAASRDLVRISSTGYEGGELGLLEVLDAYRGSADDALTVVDMEHGARRARIELDRLTGVATR